MNPSKTGNRLNGRKLLALGIGILWILTFPLCDGFLGVASAKDKRQEEKTGESWEVVNRAGRVIGSVETDGRILNRYGKQLGSVETDGTILNVRNRPIGKVDAEGTIFNQSGTRLGAVDSDGRVFNRNGRETGSVKGAPEIFLMGGAARLLLF